jgi:hypothetical protein
MKFIFKIKHFDSNRQQIFSFLHISSLSLVVVIFADPNVTL